ncbi:hypothetical protein BU14_0470s0010, partial [Porphyra umbilicalis]
TMSGAGQPDRASFAVPGHTAASSLPTASHPPPLAPRQPPRCRPPPSPPPLAPRQPPPCRPPPSPPPLAPANHLAAGRLPPPPPGPPPTTSLPAASLPPPLVPRQPPRCRPPPSPPPLVPRQPPRCRPPPPPPPGPPPTTSLPAASLPPPLAPRQLPRCRPPPSPPPWPPANHLAAGRLPPPPPGPPPTTSLPTGSLPPLPGHQPTRTSTRVQCVRARLGPAPRVARVLVSRSFALKLPFVAPSISSSPVSAQTPPVRRVATVAPPRRPPSPASTQCGQEACGSSPSRPRRGGARRSMMWRSMTRAPERPSRRTTGKPCVLEPPASCPTCGKAPRRPPARRCC